MSPAGLGHENNCAGGSAAIVNDRPTLSSDRTLHKVYFREFSAEKITGHESQEACRQNELICGKPPVVKYL
jgi:hypothetical protein